MNQHVVAAGRIAGYLLGCLLPILVMGWCVANKREFWQKLFSQEGEPSVSSYCMAVICFFEIFWCTHFVFMTKTLPDITTLTGLAMFMGAPYAIKKAKDAVVSATSNKPQV